MKLLTFASLKGGAGKTTALMAACGAMVARNLTVALFEADENQPLSAWRSNALKIKTWDDTCQIVQATDLDAFEKAYERFTEAGVQIAMADTHGGGSDLNATILASSDLIIVPTALTRIDMDATLDTLDYVSEILEANESASTPVGVLITRFNTGRLSTSEQKCLDVVTSLSIFDCRLPERNAFQDLKSTGMLHLYSRSLAEIPSKRIAATHTWKAADDAANLANDLLDTVGVDRAA